jgi:hypothetical protein
VSASATRVTAPPAQVARVVANATRFKVYCRRERLDGPTCLTWPPQGRPAPGPQPSGRNGAVQSRESARDHDVHRPDGHPVPANETKEQRVRCRPRCCTLVAQSSHGTATGGLSHSTQTARLSAVL